MRKKIPVALKNFHLFSGVTENTSRAHNIQTPQALIDLLKESKSVHTTKAIHALAITTGSNPEDPVLLYNNVMSKYVSLGEIHRARQLFDKMPQRNVVSYNGMMKAYSQVGDLQEAWRLLCEMRASGFCVTEYTLGGILCSTSMRVVQGLQLMALVAKSGFLSAGPFVGTALFGFFGRHGCFKESIRVFEDMADKNLVTFNTMISLSAQFGYVTYSLWLFLDLIRSGMEISDHTFVGLLSGFAGLPGLHLGEQIHGMIIKYGFEDSAHVSNCLIGMYARCGDIGLAEKLFEGVLVKDIVSWNAIIGKMSKGDRPEKAFAIFLRMCENGTMPNERTFASVLKSCSRLKNPSLGEFVHAIIIKRHLESDVYVGSALVDFYGKCGKIEDARHCFEEISNKNLVSWNSVMKSYSNEESSVPPLLLLGEMVLLGHRPSEFTFSTVLKSSLALEVQQLHSFIIKMGYNDNEYVLSSLITSYAKNGLVQDALLVVDSLEKPLQAVSTNAIAGIYNRARQYKKTQELISAMEEPDIVSWNILIEACSRNGDYREAFELLNHMQGAIIEPDNYTYASLFGICVKLNNLALGASLHGLIVKTDIECCDELVLNKMIDMYAKCGNLESSVKIFDAMKSKNVISWTALISAFGLHGYGQEALEKFREMEAKGVMPDKVSFIAAISACRHVGLVGQGLELFEKMKSVYGIEPERDHYHLIVDLLARYGHLKDAQDFIAGMPFLPDARIWRSFLGGCSRKKIPELVFTA